MGVLDRDEINAFTKEIVEATTEAARDAILKKLTGGGVVKSIQKGVATPSDNENNVVVSIATVDPSKCFVILNSETTGYYNGSFSSSVSVHGSMFVSLTANELTFTPCYFGSVVERTSYQVVEFY